MKKNSLFVIIMYGLSILFTLYAINPNARGLKTETECKTGIKTDYCKGWEQGYVEGYCHEEENCISPIVPICPIPKIECSKGYKCGYNRGFLKGLADK